MSVQMEIDHEGVDCINYNDDDAIDWVRSHWCRWRSIMKRRVIHAPFMINHHLASLSSCAAPPYVSPTTSRLASWSIPYLPIQFTVGYHHDLISILMIDPIFTNDRSNLYSCQYDRWSIPSWSISSSIFTNVSLCWITFETMHHFLTSKHHGMTSLANTSPFRDSIMNGIQAMHHFKSDSTLLVHLWYIYMIDPT